MKNRAKKELDDQNYYIRTEERCYYLDLSSGERIWVDKETYKNIRRLDNAEWNRKRQEMRCLVPAERGAYKRCQGDCAECKHYRGYTESYDAYVENTGNEMADPFDLRAEVGKDLLMQQVWACINANFDEVAQRILKLRMEEYTEREIAEIIGVSQKTVNNRIKRYITQLRELLKDLMD